MSRHTINLSEDDYCRLQKICHKNFRKHVQQVRKWMTQEENKEDLHNADHDGY